jgi:hypothetical protein
MAVEVKVAPDNQLELKSVFLEDRRVTSQYFNLTELPDTFTGGKNAFLIAGTDYLEPNTEVLVQIKDSNGKVVYTESSDGSPEYYEGISKVIAVYVYPSDSVEQAIDSTAFGPCTITILGELKFYDNNGSKTEVPEIWKGKYNVRYIGQANINPTLANTTRVRFFRRPQATITELLKPIYSVSGSSVSASAITASYANIKLSRLETFAGDVKRVKVYRTSEGTVSDFELIQDIQIEAKELLQTFEATGSVITDTGVFNSQILSKFWNTGSLTATLNTTQFSGSTAVRLNGSGNFRYTSSLDLSDITVYELSLDGFYTGSSESNLEIHISGSQNGDRTINTINGLFPTRNFTNYVAQFSLPKSEPTASLYFKQTQGNWFLKDISLRASAETVFSPNEVSFIVSMPTNISNETFNFKFEFFDVNNNYIPVAVTASKTFTGGNDNLTTLATTITAVSGAIDTFSGSYFEDVFSGSTSLSGSLTSSISKSVSELSQSVSRSVATSTSQSFYNLQRLADGGFSGTFIDGTTVFAPVIGGTAGYISGKFTVGAPPNSIVLDATTSTRRIYIGTGTYNNTNTKVYLDSDGKFSLTDKLTFDGTNLSINGNGTFSGDLSAAGGTFSGALSGGTISIGSGNNIFKADSNGIYLGNATFASAPFRVSMAGALTATSATITGTINVTGGNAETTSGAQSKADSARDSAISTASGDATTKANNAYNNAVSVASSDATNKSDAARNAAISAASTDATNKSNTAFNNAAAQVASLANGSYSGTFISSTTIYSPVIGGQIGYFSEQFRVGSSGIVLDGVNKRIYIGGGTFGSGGTGFYVDNNGNFSLGDKLTFNGSTLSINGSGTFSGTLSAAGGSFTGNLSGANITGATGTFAGNLAGASLSGGDLRISNGGQIVFEPFGFSTYLLREAMFTPRIRLYQNTGGSGGDDSLSFDFLYSASGLTTLGVDGLGNVKKVSSSRKYKKEITPQPLETAKRILNLNIVSFKDKDTTVSNVLHAGLIAEEVADLNYTDWVIYDNSGSVDGVYYQSIFSSMLKVVQDLNKRVEELEAKISGSL